MPSSNGPDARRDAADHGSSAALPTPPIPQAPIALFLDMDGVLAPLAPTPDAVLPDRRRTSLLRRLVVGLDGRLAIVSGRTLEEIDRIAGDASPAASGVHGLVLRRADGGVERREASPAVAVARDALIAFAADRPGLMVEDKGLAVGLHYRQGGIWAEEAVALALRLAEATGLTPQPGDMVMELKTPGCDKGTALAAFMAEPPFRGATPIMLGDDLTDEHGFEAAARLGGFGVLVGPRRPTAARHGLSGVDAVLDWLETVADAVIPNRQGAPA